MQKETPESSAVNTLESDNKNQTPRISNSKILGVLALFFAVTWVITYSISPATLDLIGDMKNEPMSTEAISGANFYPQALKNFIPWLILSPWPALAQSVRCSSSGGLECLVVGFAVIPALLVFIAIYFLFTRYVLLDAIKPGYKTKKIASAAVILTYIAFGAHIVYKQNLQPYYELNNFLATLSKVSGEKPFSSDMSSDFSGYGKSYNYIRGRNGFYEGHGRFIYQASSSNPVEMRFIYDFKDDPVGSAKQECKDSMIAPYSLIKTAEIEQIGDNLEVCVISYDILKEVGDPKIPYADRIDPKEGETFEQITKRYYIENASGKTYYRGNIFGFLDQDKKVYVNVSLVNGTLYFYNYDKSNDPYNQDKDSGIYVASGQTYYDPLRLYAEVEIEDRKYESKDVLLNRLKSALEYYRE